jgi:hypothetical protein
VPFTLVSQTVEGLMGIQPDAPRHTSTTFTNGSPTMRVWEARFLGEHRRLEVNGHRVPGLPKVIDGVRYTVALVPVLGGRTATVKVT